MPACLGRSLPPDRPGTPSVQPHTSSSLFHDLPADPAGQRRAPARRVVPDAEAAMRRLAGFGMVVLVALSLVGLGFDVAMARLGVETVTSAEAPAPPSTCR